MAISLGILLGFHIESYTKYLHSIFNYGNSSNFILSLYPQNISLSHGITLLYGVLGFTPNEKVISIVGWILFTALLTLLLKPRKRISEDEMVFVLIFIALCTISSYSAHYYLIVLNASAAILLLREKTEHSRKLFFLAFLLANSAILIPLIDFSSQPIYLQQFSSIAIVVISNVTPPLACMIYFLYVIKIVAARPKNLERSQDL
jgi:hypothetical protein